jgi:hypothetical protein
VRDAAKLMALSEELLRERRVDEGDIERLLDAVPEAVVGPRDGVGWHSAALTREGAPTSPPAVRRGVQKTAEMAATPQTRGH